MIRFLLKSAFWLMLAFLIMPRFFPSDDKTAPVAQKQAAAHTEAKPDTIEGLINHGKTALEVGKLCLDNQALCENGKSLIASAGSGLLEASGSMLEYLSTYFSDSPTEPAHPPTKATTAAQPHSKHVPATHEKAAH